MRASLSETLARRDGTSGDLVKKEIEEANSKIVKEIDNSGA